MNGAMLTAAVTAELITARIEFRKSDKFDVHSSEKVSNFSLYDYRVALYAYISYLFFIHFFNSISL